MNLIKDKLIYLLAVPVFTFLLYTLDYALSVQL